MARIESAEAVKEKRTQVELVHRDGRIWANAEDEERLGEELLANGYRLGRAREVQREDGSTETVREIVTLAAGSKFGVARDAPAPFVPPKHREEALQIGFDLWKYDPLGGAIVNLTTFFTYGRGLTIQATGAKDRVLRKFWKKNCLGDLSKTMSDEATAFGDNFLKLVPHKEDVPHPSNPQRFLWRMGEVEVIPVAPELVAAVDHDPANVRNVNSYLIRYTVEENGEKVTVEETLPPIDKYDPDQHEACMVQAKFGAASNELFGLSELVRLKEWIENYKDFLRDSVLINKLYRSPCFDVSIRDADEAEVRRAARRYEDWEIGANPIHNDKEEWQVLEFTGANVSQSESRRALLLIVAAGANLPEYMLADGSNSNLACHDEETEVLTTDGWLPHREVTKEDVVACVDEAGEMVWCAPTEVHVHDHDGEMVRVDGKHLDVLVTPNHRMRVRRQDSDEWEFRWAAELLDEGSGVTRLVTAQHAAGPDEVERIVETVTVPGCERRTRFNLPDVEVAADDMLRFLGLFVSEGGLNYGSGGQIAHTVYLSQKTPGKIAIFDGVLEGLPWKFYRREDSTGSVRWSVGNKALFGWLALECGDRAWKKRLPEWCLLDLTRTQSIVLLEYLVIGDGMFEPDRRPGSMSYRTTSPQLADQVQTLALRCGYAANVVETGCRTTTTDRPVYQVNIRMQRTEPCLKRIVSKTWYEGKVYCLTVPTGVYVTRRNGKVAVLGNSAKAQQLPAVKKFEDRQETYRIFWTRVLEFVLDIAVSVGQTQGVEMDLDEEGDPRWDIAVKFPPISLEKDKEVAESNKLGIEGGYMSPQSAAARMGLDYELELELQYQAAVDQEKLALRLEGFKASADFQELKRDLVGAEEGMEDLESMVEGEETESTVEEPVEVG